MKNKGNWVKNNSKGNKVKTIIKMTRSEKFQRVTVYKILKITA